MRGNHFLETQSKASRNRAEVHRRPTPADAPRVSRACVPSYELRHWYFPSSGSSEIEVTYNAVTETISLAYNATPSAVETAINAHTEMVSAGVECTASASVSGGNLWRSSVIVRMPTGATIGFGATPDGDLAPDASTDYEPHLTVVECGCQ